MTGPGFLVANSMGLFMMVFPRRRVGNSFSQGCRFVRAARGGAAVIHGTMLIDGRANLAYPTAAYEACPNLVRDRHYCVRGMALPGGLGRLRRHIGAAVASP